MKLVNKYLELDLYIEDDLIKKLTVEGRKYFPSEFGGILIGRYSENKKELFVTETILSEPQKLSRYKFDRRIPDLRNTLKQFYKQEPSLHYVGEWHTHPDNLPIPSKTDWKAMCEITNHNEVLIENPILIIIGLTLVAYNLKVYVFNEQKLYEYEQ